MGSRPWLQINTDYTWQCRRLWLWTKDRAGPRIERGEPQCAHSRIVPSATFPDSVFLVFFWPRKKKVLLCFPIVDSLLQVWELIWVSHLSQRVSKAKGAVASLVKLGLNEEHSALYQWFRYNYEPKAAGWGAFHVLTTVTTPSERHRLAI